MTSSVKTPNYGLNQWQPGDKPSFDDFNADNLIVDTNAAKLSTPDATNWDSGNFLIESGTFVPYFAGYTTAGSMTYTAQTGWYKKRGDMVDIWLLLTVGAISVAPSGIVMIRGLPFNFASIPSAAQTPFIITNTFSISGNYPGIGVGSSPSNILLRTPSSTAYFNIDGIAVGATIGGHMRYCAA